MITGVAAFFSCDQWIATSTSARIYATVAAIPPRDVALVLGTSPTVADGRRNLYFTRRIDAAAELFAAGKVRHLPVSGDNHVKEYDEPTAMRDALVTRGVPASAITLDYAGFRTLDFVTRARTAFGLTRLIIVAQRFHEQRALFIADSSGLDAIALEARAVGSSNHLKVRLREVLARTRAVLDVCVLGTKARFPGPKEKAVLC